MGVVVTEIYPGRPRPAGHFLRALLRTDVLGLPEALVDDPHVPVLRVLEARTERAPVAAPAAKTAPTLRRYQRK